MVTQCKILATTPLIEMSALAILETAELNRECVSCGGHNELIFCHDCSESRCDNCSILWHKHPKRLSHNLQVYLVLASVPALSCRCMHNLTYLLLYLLSILSLLYLPSFCLASLQHLFSVLANGYSYLVF